jgi:hypothetical protein
MPPQYSLLLLAGLACWYTAYALSQPPVLRICRCGDAIYLVPGWPSKCPSCGRWMVG